MVFPWIFFFHTRLNKPWYLLGVIVLCSHFLIHTILCIQWLDKMFWRYWHLTEMSILKEFLFFFSCLSGFNDSCLRTLLMICLFLYNYFCYKETAVKFLLWIFIWGKTSSFFPHVPWTVDLYVARRPLTVHQAVWYLLIISLFDNQGIIPWFQSIEASFLKELSQVEEAVYLTDRPAWLKSRFLTWNIILLLIFSPNQKSVLLY